MITPIELDDAKYNARDVLTMCRTWSYLVADAERFEVAPVYEIDEQLADLALQMTRIGLPVDSALRQQIGERLRKLRDSALDVLQTYTKGENQEAFMEWVATFFATKARKGEPTLGSLRIGPSRARAAVDEIASVRKEWLAYRKSLPTGPR